MDLPQRNNIRPNKYTGLTLYILLVLGFLIFSLTGYLYTLPPTGPDAPGCRQAWMSPSYARIKGFDESHTKFASKYSLYLYREQWKDKIPDEKNGFDLLDGIPVLFIPGNAGSYRQVRSIASECTNLYHGEFEKYHDINPKFRNLDVFTADFNEDFTAFHGRTILDQAEYLNEAVRFIIDLYSQNEHPAKSVIIIGHSMGGIVSRVMVTLPNYLEGSINTILTLSSPHAAAPLTFDGDILKIYSAIDRFWFDGFDPHSTSDYAKLAHDRLKNISLISITGGELDSTLPADYTTLSFLVPPTNGFTTFTTGIPLVWSPIDHLAIVWCAQLRRRIAESLLEVVDYDSPYKTIPLQQRMKVFRKQFLTGFEDYSSQDFVGLTGGDNNVINLKIDSQQLNYIGKENSIVIGKENQSIRKFNLFSLEKEENQTFSLISSQKLSKKVDFNSEKGPLVLLCSKFGGEEYVDAIAMDDLTDQQTTEFNAMKCVDISVDSTVVPCSTRDTDSLADSSLGGNKSPFYSLELNSTILNKYDHLLIVQKPISTDRDFLMAQLNEESTTKFNIKGNLFTLFTSSGSESLPSDRPLSVTIDIPGAWNSIFVYKLKLNGLSIEGDHFTSFIRQYSDEPYETKWYINLDKSQELSLSMHGIAPFIPYRLKTNYGMKIQLWTDISSLTHETTTDIEISIDWIRSLRLLVLRYRISIISMIVSIVALVLLIQFRLYVNGKFPSFINILCLVNQKAWWLIGLALIILNPVVKIHGVQMILNLLDPVVVQDSNEINLSIHSNYKLNGFYLGLDEEFSIVGIVLYLVANFIIIMTYFMILTICTIVRSVTDRFFIRHASKARKSSVDNNSTDSLSEKSKAEPIATPNYRRIIATILLIGAIPIYIPYQFVFTVCCFVQIINVIKCWHLQQVFNLQVSLLILMLWILPINVPIIIVFIHNQAVNWKTPFSSHHNLLSIIPIFVFVLRNNFKKIPKIKLKYINVLQWYLIYVIGYSLIYGGRHTYWLHHLFNLLCCILIIMFYDTKEEEESGEKSSRS
ncbi:BST1 [[Candida] subhashii]|uniref:BST1 n=1 Tax=[Candida] subhashii TaxID=561895 RepID=A0A8J5UEL8_9ASCO|nr:BST1 [[Candida] subhashii]KAG7661278.1 BST1 [[Candida] subhashii]